ncbi:MAG: FHA domain-containing protein [Deltaproteobacteria bacterium]|nr:FHA domain-containing protein [Deltaproteobacteria bacterium]MCB9785937.1 FHA domain-containing protein [Deltaproteobacteria bacterium]
MVFDFLKNLGRSRINGVQASAKAKAMGVQAKAKGKVAAKFNKAVDGATDKAKGAAKGAAPKKDQAGKKDDGAMGLFGRKNKGGDASAPAPAQEAAAEFGDKTQFIQVVQEKPKECVGWVVALNGPLKGQDFRLVTGKNVMGTAADCDIVLTDQYMSARHAVLRHEEGVFVLVDLDSTNGSFVNGDRTSKEELIDNDRLRLGRTELKFKSLY